jgi:hypothetical protein
MCSGFIHHPAATIISVREIGLLPTTQASHFLTQFNISLAAAVSLLSSARLLNQFCSAILYCHSLNALSILVANSDCLAVHLVK